MASGVGCEKESSSRRGPAESGGLSCVGTPSLLASEPLFAWHRERWRTTYNGRQRRFRTATPDPRTPNSQSEFRRRSYIALHLASVVWQRRRYTYMTTTPTARIGLLPLLWCNLRQLHLRKKQFLRSQRPRRTAASLSHPTCGRHT